MGIYKFVVGEILDCTIPQLDGACVEVEYHLIGGKSLDEKELAKWSLMIAEDFVLNYWTRDELLDESIHIRITRGAEVIVDTISDRVRPTE